MSYPKLQEDPGAGMLAAEREAGGWAEYGVGAIFKITSFLSHDYHRGTSEAEAVEAPEFVGSEAEIGGTT